jgi:hypothetical protein
MRNRHQIFGILTVTFMLGLAPEARAVKQRVPTGWVGGADLLLGISLPAENPVGGESGLSPAVQGQLRLGHELGRAGRYGRLEGLLAGFVTHPSGTSDWGITSTYAIQGYGGLRYTTPLFKIISLNVGGGYGGILAFGTEPSRLLPSVADGHGPVVSGGLDIGIRWVGLIVEANHFFTIGNLTYVMGGVRFGR